MACFVIVIGSSIFSFELDFDHVTYVRGYIHIVNWTNVLFLSLNYFGHLPLVTILGHTDVSIIWFLVSFDCVLTVAIDNGLNQNSYRLNLELFTLLLTTVGHIIHKKVGNILGLTKYLKTVTIVFLEYPYQMAIVLEDLGLYCWKLFDGVHGCFTPVCILQFGLYPLANFCVYPEGILFVRIRFCLDKLWVRWCL